MGQIRQPDRSSGLPLQMDFGNGGGTSFVEVTKSELDQLITNRNLVKGATYKISKVNTGYNEMFPPIYYNGSDYGIVVYLKAINAFQLEKTGIGEFYNPIYNMDAPNYSIWNFNVSYNIGDIVNWGGYAWRNLDGTQGSSIDILTLNESWEKVPYDLINYNKVYNEITYNYEFDLITRRFEENGSNLVQIDNFSIMLTSMYSGMGYPVNPISVFKWGWPINFYAVYGMGNIYVVDSVFECVNYAGRLLYDIKLNGFSHIKSLNANSDTFINTIRLDNGSYIENITNVDSVNNITLTDSSSMTNLNSNTNSGEFSYINLSGQSYFNNIAADDSNVNNIRLFKSSLGDMTLTEGALLSNITLNKAQFSNCTIAGSVIQNINLLQDSYITGLGLSKGTMIKDCNLDQLAYLSNLTFNGNGTLSGCNLRKGANIYACGFDVYSALTDCQLDSYASIADLEIGAYTNISKNKFEELAHLNMTGFGANVMFAYNTFKKDSSLVMSSFYDSCVFNYNEIGMNSSLSSMNFHTNTSFNNNILHNNCTLSKNHLVEGYHFANNIFENNCSIENSFLNPTTWNTFRFRTLLNNVDFGTALNSYFSLSYPKEIYSTPSGAVKIRWYNDSDVNIIVDLLG